MPYMAAEAIQFLTVNSHNIRAVGQAPSPREICARESPASLTSACHRQGWPAVYGRSAALVERPLTLKPPA